MTQAGYFETRRFNPGSFAMAAAIEIALIGGAVAWQLEETVREKPFATTILDIKDIKEPIPETDKPKPQIPPKQPKVDRSKTETEVPPVGPDIEDITKTVRDSTETGPIWVPPLDPPRILESARAKGDVRSLMTPEDYPEPARRRGETGTVRARLDIGVSGKVTGCTIVASSGSPRLDSTTCNLLKLRARFTPAKNGNGELVSDTYTTPKIVWAIERTG